MGLPPESGNDDVLLVASLAIFNECYLNSQGPASMVGGSWPNQQTRGAAMLEDLGSSFERPYHSPPVILASTSDQSPQHKVHAVLRVNGEVNRKKLSVLIDSGATVSAINQEVVAEPCINLPESQQSTTIGANGLPLDVV